MIYQLNKLVNIAFISICVVCEHLMKQIECDYTQIFVKVGITCFN